MRLLNKIYLLLFISLSLGLKAQNYQERQKQLEAQKISIKKEIQQINNLINDSRKKSRGLADELEDIQLKISVRDRLIRINISQVNNLYQFRTRYLLGHSNNHSLGPCSFYES